MDSKKQEEFGLDKLLYCEDGEAMEQAAQRNCRCTTSLSVFKSSLDGPLSNIVQCPCPWQRHWNKMILKVPSNPSHFVTVTAEEKRQQLKAILCVLQQQLFSLRNISYKLISTINLFKPYFS